MNIDCNSPIKKLSAGESLLILWMVVVAIAFFSQFIPYFGIAFDLMVRLISLIKR